MTRRTLTLAGTALALLVAAVVVWLVSGGDDNDPGGATLDDGLVLTAGRGNAYPRGIEVSDSGRITLAVASWDGRRWGTTLLRRNPDGGEETTSEVPVGRAVAIGEASAGIGEDADDPLLVLGYRSDGVAALARVRPDGEISPLFGDGGVTELGSNPPAAFASYENGSIAVALRGRGAEVIRIAPTGSTKLPVKLEVPGADDGQARVVALEHTGNLVVAGEILQDGGASARPFLARFSGGAVMSVAVAPEAPAEARWNSVAVHPDGFVTVAGTARDNGRAVVATARFAPDGSPGTTSTTPIGNADAFTGDITPAPGGGVFVAATANGRAHLVHLRRDGSLDPRFRRPTVDGRAAALALEDDGSVIVVTSVWAKSRQAVHLRRLQGLGKGPRG